MPTIQALQTGLRTRQKSRRRREILDQARHLFETLGYDATTMARIAQAAEVSTPTVFNYFGSKDELIIGLVLEGHEAGREALLQWHPDADLPLGDMLGDLMCRYLELTMDIAGKRVWRYAEATNIRRPGSDVVRLYARIESNHISEITRFLRAYLPPGPNTPDGSCEVLAAAVYHHWNALFFHFIRNEDLTMDDHMQVIRKDMKALAALIAPAAQERAI